MTAPFPLEAHRMAGTLVALLRGASLDQAISQATARTLDHVERVGRDFASPFWEQLDSDGRHAAIVVGLVKLGHEPTAALLFADAWRRDPRGRGGVGAKDALRPSEQAPSGGKAQGRAPHRRAAGAST